MGRGARCLERLDGQIVHADHPDSAGHETFGPSRGNAHIIGPKVRHSPETGILRLEEHPELARQIQPSQFVGANVSSREDFDHSGAADQELEWQSLGARTVIEEVARRVHVRSGMRAQMEGRNVRAVSSGESLVGLECEWCVARVRGKSRVEGNGDVDELHGDRWVGRLLELSEEKAAPVGRILAQRSAAEVQLRKGLT